MNNIFVKIEEIPQWLIDKYFKNKDLVSVDEIIATLDNVDYELRELQEDFNNYKNYVEENYQEIPERDKIGYDERTW